MICKLHKHKNRWTSHLYKTVSFTTASGQLLSHRNTEITPTLQPWASHMLEKCSSTELYPQALFSFWAGSYVVQAGPQPSLNEAMQLQAYAIMPRQNFFLRELFVVISW